MYFNYVHACRSRVRVRAAPFTINYYIRTVIIYMCGLWSVSNSISAYCYELRLRLFYLSHTRLYREYITSSEMYSLHLTHPK